MDGWVSGWLAWLSWWLGCLVQMRAVSAYRSFNNDKTLKLFACSCRYSFLFLPCVNTKCSRDRLRRGQSVKHNATMTGVGGEEGREVGG